MTQCESGREEKVRMAKNQKERCKEGSGVVREEDVRLRA